VRGQAGLLTRCPVTHPVNHVVKSQSASGELAGGRLAAAASDEDYVPDKRDPRGVCGITAPLILVVSTGTWVNRPGTQDVLDR